MQGVKVRNLDATRVFLSQPGVRRQSLASFEYAAENFGEDELTCRLFTDPGRPSITRRGKATQDERFPPSPTHPAQTVDGAAAGGTGLWNLRGTSSPHS